MRFAPMLTLLCNLALAQPQGTLAVIARVEYLDVGGREPMIVEHPSGALFVSTYGEPRPILWRSSDHGATWSRIDVGKETDGAIGSSDVDLAVAPDGTLYFVTLVFDRQAREGTHISIGVSRDVGVTWRWSLLSKEHNVDRPWVAVSKDGAAHVFWSDVSLSGLFGIVPSTLFGMPKPSLTVQRLGPFPAGI